MMNERLCLLKFSLKLQSGWSALIALLLVLVLDGTHFFWFDYLQLLLFYTCFLLSNNYL